MNELRQIRENSLLQGLSRQLQSVRLSEPVTLMEVCGTHTMAIHRAGLPTLLPPNLRLLSGPGCPVCVTPVSYLDTACAIARQYDVTLTTFGDMMRVPGTDGTLADLRSEGYPVDTVYSPFHSVTLAQQKPESQVVFLAVGFETTAPVVAASVKYAYDIGINNFSILSAHKLVIPALKILIDDNRIFVDGFLLPGHVSVILGSEPYRFIAEKNAKACVITGFETADIIQGILLLIDQVQKRDFIVAIQYRRVVKPEGNTKARAVIDEVFESADTEWRGFGVIPESGLMLRDEFGAFDASERFPVHMEMHNEPVGCRCGDVLRGYIEPPECPLFARGCSPEHPVGPCMVSTEGTCAAYYRFSRLQGDI
ncbi:MAG: hydrogenase formation protein HypD [Candidatus Latescibacteria bacterium]|nr:hydrogenase formation protein HypD [Candidatus Latescibacterota bacterium]